MIKKSMFIVATKKHLMGNVRGVLVMTLLEML